MTEKSVVRNILLTVLFLVLFPLGLAEAGNDNGNGGDGYAAEFVATAKTAVRLLKNHPTDESIPDYGIDLKQFETAVKTTAVHSEERLFLDDQEVDAINYPQKKLIKISRSRWKELRSNDQEQARYRLVIHEYLFIIGIDDQQYRVSDGIMESLSRFFSDQVIISPMSLTFHLDNVPFDFKLNDRFTKFELVCEQGTQDDYSPERVYLKLNSLVSSKKDGSNSYSISVFVTQKIIMQSPFAPKPGKRVLCYAELHIELDYPHLEDHPYDRTDSFTVQLFEKATHFQTDVTSKFMSRYSDLNIPLAKVEDVASPKGTCTMEGIFPANIGGSHAAFSERFPCSAIPKMP